MEQRTPKENIRTGFFLKSSQKHRRTNHLKKNVLGCVEWEYTAESVRGQAAMNAGTSQ